MRDDRATITRLLGDVPVQPLGAGLDHRVYAGRITGVIDWGDATIGDPALDHGRLLRDFGPAGGGDDRARFYAVCAALEDLAFGLRTDRHVYSENARAALNELT